MKKEYKDLELETVRFDAEDVITASGAPCDCDCPTVKVLVPCPDAICECKGTYGIICRCNAEK